MCTTIAPRVLHFSAVHYSCCCFCCFGVLAVFCFLFIPTADSPRITPHPQRLKNAVPGQPVAFTMQAERTEPLDYTIGKSGNYNDCNSQFFIGFAIIVKILPWLYSILQLYNATSCLHLHLFVNTFNTTLLQQLYNNWIQKHNRITIFQLAVQTTTIVILVH